MSDRLRRLMVGLLAGCCVVAALAEEPPREKPAWQRLLQGEDATKAEKLQERMDELLQAGRFAEALSSAEALAELRQERQGKEHWEAVTARFAVGAMRRVLRTSKEEQKEYAASFALDTRAESLEQKGEHREALPLREQVRAIRRKVLGEEHPDTAATYNNLAANLNAQGRYKEAEEGYKKALDIWRTVLSEEHPLTAYGYNNVAENLNAQGRYKEAVEGYQKALKIFRKVLGDENPNTAAGYNNVAANLHEQSRYKEAEEGYQKGLDIFRKVLGEEHRLTATGYNNVAANLNAQGRYKEAEPGYRRALDIWRKVLGEEHPDTATSYNNLGLNLNDQGRYKEAEDGFRKALAIRRKVLGEQHPYTATSYDSVAFNLNAQGRYKEAEENCKKALEIYRKVLGDEHPDTARGYNSVAFNLHAQGRYREAEEGHKKALDIFRKVLGDEHPDTAKSYNNLASNLYDQGRYQEAEECYQKALDILRKVLGEEHPHTAQSYHNVAFNLKEQGRYKEAEDGFQKALNIFRKVLGEEHPNTASSYDSFAFNSSARGRYKEAEEGHRKVLAIRRKVLGEEHPDTASSYSKLALNLNEQGRYKEAEESNRKALDIFRKVQGEDSPDTASSYNNVARNLNAQGRYQEAEQLYSRGADAFLTSRLQIAASGLGRAARTTEVSPLLRLAALLARNGKPSAAWQRLEQSLGRGTWDDLSARLRRPAKEVARHTELVRELERLDQLLTQHSVIKKPTAAQEQERDALLDRRRQAREQVTRFLHHLEETYGPAEGKVFDREQVQAALPPDTALVVWIDLPAVGPKAADPDGEHWAVLLRSRGEPVFERLRGSGSASAWTDDDTRLPDDLRTALEKRRDIWQRLAEQLRQQRLQPLRKHLAASEKLPAVRHLVVLPSAALAGLPVEVLAPEHTLSYALSGTLYAHLKRQPAVKSAGLLALGDPVFDAAAVAAKERPLPPGGVLLTLVQPGSNAARARLRADDVLLKYGDKDLTRPEDLSAAIAAAGASGDVAVQVWRDGVTRRREVAPGKLGVVMASQPAPKALAERYRMDRVLASRSGDDGWSALPGTRVEVESLRRLFSDKPEPRLLFDSDASQQKLDELAAAGKLGKYRYLHLATHGEVDVAMSLRSAVILSRDTLPDPQKQLLAGKPVYDGRLTAAEMLRTWHLNADLVTLSACQTGLGKYERGEGFVGFAQTVLVCGSRSVCLSLWKVDDSATALLMQRFYANLLGKRAGLAAPMPKAQALREAKEWLRNLPREEALHVAAELSQGVERGKGRPRQKPLPEPAPGAKDDRPYAHPYYWAAFVLIGDPGS